ncbi:MAG: NADH-quinone oxidoreductase subunit A [Gaiellales bacterium]
MLGQWAAFLVYAAFAAMIPASLIAASFILATRSNRRAGDKLIPFESGVSSQTTFVPHRFTISYYVTAMLFIVFDIEIVFLYPLAVRLDALGTFGLAELGVFVALLAVAYVYIWRKGALEWR